MNFKVALSSLFLGVSMSKNLRFSDRRNSSGIMSLGISILRESTASGCLADMFCTASWPSRDRNQKTLNRRLSSQSAWRMAQSVLPQSLPQETSHYNRSPISLIEGNGHLAHFGYQIDQFWLGENSYQLVGTEGKTQSYQKVIAQRAKLRSPQL